MREATAVRQLPDTVRVEVAEYEPVALLQADGLYYVDAEGRVFLRARGDDLDYPVLTGLSADLEAVHPILPRLAIRDALRLLAELDAQGTVSRDEVSEIAFSPTRGFTFSLMGGSELRFGLDGYERQVDRLGALVAQDLDLRTPVLVDLAPESVAIVRSLEDDEADG